MEDAMLEEEEDTILGNEDRSIASEERPQPASGSGSVLLSEDSSVPLNGGAAAVKEGAASEQVARASADGSLPASRGKLLIVIPAYNEGGRVGAVVADVRQALPDADVVVIDDGSEDATPAEAAAAGAIALSLPANCGYGIALQTGYKYAVRHGY